MKEWQHCNGELEVHTTDWGVRVNRHMEIAVKRSMKGVGNVEISTKEKARSELA